MSWAFATKIDDLSENDFPKDRKKLEDLDLGGKHSMSNRKEKKEENRERTQTRKHPNGYP